MKRISDFPDLHRFLSFLCVQFRKSQHQTGLSSQNFGPRISDPGFGKFIELDDIYFWMEKLSSYVITGREPIPNFMYRSSITIHTVPLASEDFFEPDDYLMLNADCGLFLAHTQEDGYIGEFELHFRENLTPSFFPALILSYPVGNETPSELLRDILKIGATQVSQIEKEFQETGLTVIENE